MFLAFVKSSQLISFTNINHRLGLVGMIHALKPAKFAKQIIKTMKTSILATAIVTGVVTAFSVQAQYTEIDISSQVNGNIQAYTAGYNYQLGGTPLNVAGVPFGLAELNNDPTTTGVIQAPSSSPNSGFPTGNAGSFAYTFSVPTGTEATALYSLANTAWGAAGVDEGSIVVTGTDGETATLTLTEGFNIRDHYNGSYVNSLTDPSVVSTYFQNGSPATGGLVRLDRQELVLPSSFTGDTIASIEFEGYANGAPDGSAFLAGLTLSDASVPEMPSPAVLGLAVVALAAARRLLPVKA